MSVSIDRRVVEMRFDNKEFERNVKTSMSTLDRLKEALSFTKSTKALENLGKAANDIKLDGIASSIKLLEERFSTMGIVGMRVIENITDALMGKFSQAINYASDAIISGGIKRAMNIENAHFQLQALLKDEQKVQAVMADAMESVDGTAYAYDEAAKAAAQFAASGLQAGDEMLGALKGITGVAAMTNSDFESMARIFTTVAGNGRLMGDQLLQLSSRGLNAASTIADYLREVQGMSKITEADVREMVSHSEVSFEMFANAMQWAFGDSAKRANETFTGALSNMRSALARIGADFVSPLIEQNSDLVGLFNTLRVSINTVRKAFQFDEQASAISGLHKYTKLENDELKDMFDNIKKNGSLSYGDIVKLNTSAKNGVNVIKDLTKYINGVTSGSTRATYAITSNLKDITGGLEITEKDVRRLVDEGKIDIATFQAAMEQSYGDQKKLSKRFSDFVLDNVKAISQAIEATDLTKPMEAVTTSIEAVINIFKGLASVVKPVGKAFADVFLSFSGDDMVNFANALERVTSKMKLSEKSSKNLQDAFKGIFNVVKLVIDAFLKMIGVSTSMLDPMGSIIDLLLAIAGGAGRALTEFTEWVRQSATLQKLFEIISKGFQAGAKAIKYFVEHIDELIDEFLKIPVVSKTLDKLESGLTKLWDVIKKGGKSAVENIKEFAEWINKLIPKDADNIIDTFRITFQNLKTELNGSDFSTSIGWLDNLTSAIQKLVNAETGNKGLDTFIKNFKNFVNRLETEFSFDNIIYKIAHFKETIEDFKDWVVKSMTTGVGGAGTSLPKLLFGEMIDMDLSGTGNGGMPPGTEVFKKSFDKFIEWITGIGSYFEENVTPGGVIAVGGGIGIIAMINNVAKSLNRFSKSIGGGIGGTLKGVNSALTELKNTLVTWQLELKASALIKIAGAIGILAGAITLLSFADMNNAWEAALMLGTLGTASIWAVSQFGQVITKTKTIEDSIFQFSKGIKKAMGNLTASVKWKAIGSAVKDMAVALVAVIGSIAAVVYLYKKDPEALTYAVELVGKISATIVFIIAAMSLIMEQLDSGASNFAKIGVGMLAMAASVGIIILALDKLFKMELPNDYGEKLLILGAILLAVGELALVVGVASLLAGDGKLKVGPIIAVAALLVVAVGSLDKLFKMKLPGDYGERFAMLMGIFAALGLLMVEVGLAASLSKDSNKAAGIILATAAFLAVATGSLMFLSMIPGDKMLKGAVALGAVLVAMGASVALAGTSSSPDAWKTVLAMTAAVGVITASLGILSTLKTSALAKSSAALGAILIALGYDLKQAAKVTNKGSVYAVVAMCVAIGEIAISLGILALLPWQGMLSAGAAMSATLLAFGAAFKMITDNEYSSGTLKNMAVFGLLVAESIPIAIELGVLAKQPWAGLLAAGVAMSGTMVALSAVFKIITSSEWSNDALKNIGTFALLVLETIPIAIEIGKLAELPWEGLLAAATAMSGTMLALSLCFAIIGNAQVPGLDTLLAFGALVLATIPIAVELNVLAQNDWAQLLSAAASLSLVLISLSACLAILTAMDANIGSAFNAATALVTFIGVLGAAMLGIGALFETFENLESTLDTGIAILIKVGDGLGQFAGAIINGFLQQVFQSLPALGENLSAFWDEGSKFFDGIGNLPESTFGNMILLAGALLAFCVAELIAGIAQLLGAKILANVGTELSEFMENAQGFFDGLSGINSETVEAAKNVAQMIMAFTVAELLEGISKWLGFSGSLSDFGEQLKEFGPAISEFAEQVKDVKPEAVEGAANAAKVMAEAAKNLPGQDGLMQKIFGSHSLAEFAEELLAFGPAIVAFSAIVKDVNPEAVQGAADATTIMSEVANGLPSQDGWVDKIFGSKKLSEFGEELLAFAPSIVGFAETVNGLDPSAVTGAATVTQIMSTLADNLPNSGGLISIFTGNNDIDVFGERLELFGQHFKVFYDYVSALDADEITEIIGVFYDLIQLTTDLKGIDQKAIVNFANGLKGVADGGIDAFCEAFDNAHQKAVDAIKSLLKACIDEIQGTELQFYTAGLGTALQWITAVEGRKEAAKSAGKTLATNALDGIKSQDQYFRSSGIDLASKCLYGITSMSGSFYSAGQNAGRGFVNGLSSMMGAATSAGRALGQAAYEAAKKALDEHSPSKKMAEVGDYAGEGFVNALSAYVERARISGEDVGTSALDGMKESMNQNGRLIRDEFIDFDPVVRPEVDLTNVRRSTEDIARMFNTAVSDISAGTVSVSASVKRIKTAKEIADQGRPRGQQETEDKTEYIFNQYNTSPKALSRTEIYRNTRNQFSQFKELVNNK